MNSSVKYIGFTALSVAVAGIVLAARAAADNSALQLTAFSSAPLCFEARSSGVDGSAGFIARGVECSVLIAPDGADIILGKAADETIPHQPKSARAVRLQLVGANPQAQLSGLDRMAATANYFIGSDSSTWRSGLPLFGRVQVSDVYPGAQLVYYANQSAQLEYDFVLQPDSHPEQIRFRVEGADEVWVDKAGNLVLKIDGQEICQHPPEVYQERGGARTPVTASYHLNQDGTVGFSLADFDRSQPLVIDPVLDFLSYIGGKGLTIGWGIALTNGNIYVAGETLSKNVLTILGITNVIVPTNSDGQVFFNFTNLQGRVGGFGDAFIASYTTNGLLNYFSYLGGRQADGALGIAAAGDGSVWITGFTDSRDFPITNGILSTNSLFSTLSGPTNNARAIPAADAFIAHVSAGGTNLLFSTYFGGNSIDEGTGIALDANNNVFVTGLSSSTTNFPVTANAFQSITKGSFDAYVAEFVPNPTPDFTNGYTTTYSTLFGGTNLDYGLGIAVDSSDNIWVSGITFSTNLFITNWEELAGDFATNLPNGIETNHVFNGLNSQTNRPHRSTGFHSDGFVTEFSTNGAVLFSTFLGGSNDDAAVRLAIDPQNNVYVVGYTLSRNFPTNIGTGLIFTNIISDTNDFPNGTTNVFINRTTNFVSHAFVTKLIPGTNSPDYVIGASTAFGGDRADRATSITLDGSGNVYVIGSAGSTNFFATNVAILTNTVPASTNINKHGVITNFAGMGFVTNNFTFTDLTSTNFTRRDRRSPGNTNDIFIAVLSPDLSHYLESIILGGPGDNEPNGIAVEQDGSAVYFVGATTSKTNFATPNAVQPVFIKGGRPLGFVGRIGGMQPFP
jgi:Beta-propeller repeat